MQFQTNLGFSGRAKNAHLFSIQLLRVQRRQSMNLKSIFHSAKDLKKLNGKFKKYIKMSSTQLFGHLKLSI